MPKTPAQLADDAAEAIRALNRLTRTAGPGWEYPADAYDVVGNLLPAIQRLPQLFDQVARHIQRLADENHLRSTRGLTVTTAVSAALDALGRAGQDAAQMAAALDTAHSALSPLAYQD
jgi:hypothetical protein